MSFALFLASGGVLLTEVYSSCLLCVVPSKRPLGWGHVGSFGPGEARALPGSQTHFLVCTAGGVSVSGCDQGPRGRSGSVTESAAGPAGPGRRRLPLQLCSPLPVLSAAGLTHLGPSLLFLGRESFVLTSVPCSAFGPDGSSCLQLKNRAHSSARWFFQHLPTCPFVLMLPSFPDVDAVSSLPLPCPQEPSCWTRDPFLH